jgi:hypothetical protein
VIVWDNIGHLKITLAIWRYQSSEVSAWTMGVGFNRLFGEYQLLQYLILLKFV